MLSAAVLSVGSAYKCGIFFMRSGDFADILWGRYTTSRI